MTTRPRLDAVPARHETGRVIGPAEDERWSVRRLSAYQLDLHCSPRPVFATEPLKILAVEQDRTMHSLVAGALNDLFAKYGKPRTGPGTEQDG